MGKQLHAAIKEVEEDNDPDEGKNIVVQAKGMGKKPHKGKVNPYWVLLDSQSTTHQIVNPHLLENIKKAAKPTNIHCNAGSTSPNLEGDIGKTTVLHNPYGIANMMSLFLAQEDHHITYNSRDCGGSSRCTRMMELSSSSQASKDCIIMMCPIVIQTSSSCL